MELENHFLSIIIPCYKQEKLIAEDLKNIWHAVQKSRFDFEIICVIDGKTDNTYTKIKKLKLKKVKILSYAINKGKGYAVRYGMSRAKGDLIAFLDAGMDISPNGLSMLLEHMFWYQSDVIVGSIRHSASKVIGYPLKRKVLSWGYHNLTKWLFGLKITDSQRGIKIFKRKVLEKVLPRLLVKRFAFDIEMLAVANRLGFARIHDGPVELDARKMRYSTIKTGTIWDMFLGTLSVYYRLNILHYYDSKNRRYWQNDPNLNFAK